MSLKTSFFNKTIFKSDIKRFWWISIAEAVLLVIFTIIPLYDKCLWAYRNNAPSINARGDGAMIISMIASFGTAVRLFTYMHYNGSVSFVHSLPVKRKALFATRILSGLAITVLPLIATALAMLGMSYGRVCGQYILLSDVAEWFFCALWYLMIVFSLTVCVNMMTGNPVGTIVFTIGFALLPLWINTILHYVLTTELYGYTSENTEKILRYIYIGPEGLLKKEYILIYPVLSILITVGAFHLYRIRKSESHGEVIAFRWLIPLFIGIISALASGLGYAYARDVLDIQSMLTMLPFGIIGTLVSWMISRKAFGFRGCTKPIAVYIAGALIFMGIIHFDITGFETRVPQADNIKSATVGYMSVYDMPLFEDSDDIQNVIALHVHLISQKGRKNDQSFSMPITYELKNGRTLKRTYNANALLDEAFLKPVYETEEYRKSRFDTLKTDDEAFREVRINDRRIGADLTFYPDDKTMLMLINEAKKDMKSYPYDAFREGLTSSTTLHIYRNEKNERTGQTYSHQEELNINEYTPHTAEALRKIGFFERIPAAEDIASVYITVNLSLEGKNISEENVTDSKRICELYGIYEEMLSGKTFTDYENAFDVYMTYNLKNGRSFDVSCTYDRDKVPAILKENVKKD